MSIPDDVARSGVDGPPPPGGPPPANAPVARRVPRVLAPFRHAAYRRLALALVLQTFAAGMWTVAIVWEVIRLGGGPSQLSLVATAGALGMVLPVLLGGVVADRVAQKVTLLIVTMVELAGMGVIGALSLAGTNSLVSLSVVAFVIGLAMAFYFPAYTAWLPALVPEHELMAVNGFEGMVRPALNQALGPAAAGAIVAAISPGAAITVASVVSSAGVLALTFVPRTEIRRDLAALGDVHPVAAAWRDVREGMHYLVRTQWLFATLLFASLLVLAIMGPIEVLVPFLIKDRLHGGSQHHAWVLAAYGVGAALGSLAMGSVRMPRRYLTVMVLGWGLGALPLVVMALAGAIWQVVASGFVLGVCFGAPTVIWGTLLQRRVPSHLLGRVSSLDFFVSLIFMPVSMALAGPVSSLLGVRLTFVVAGMVPVVLAGVTIMAFQLPRDELTHPLRDEAPAMSPVAS